MALVMPPEAGALSRRSADEGVSPPGSPAARVDAIDLLRGLVIVLMVLDHVREYFSASALLFEATDLARTTVPLFATRWITHLCAPTFVFLAGVGAWLQHERAAAPAPVARFLLTRGLWLIALELTVISFGFEFASPFAFFQVIWAIGIGFVMLAALVRVPRVAVLSLGLAIVALHGLIPAPAGGQPPDALRQLFLAPGAAPWGLPGIVAYPALPWFGVMCLGYGFGPLFSRDDAGRRRAMLALGGAALAAFVVLRAANGFGDPAPWSAQRDGTFTALSFLKVSKYPPSLLYVLVTLGISLPLGVALERLRGLPARVLLAFGRTPLFTYLVHVYAVHGLALVAGLGFGYRASSFTHFISDPVRLRVVEWGLGLPAVYAVWLLVLAGLYPISRWYAALKAERRAWWMRYL